MVMVKLNFCAKKKSTQIPHGQLRYFIECGQFVFYGTSRCILCQRFIFFARDERESAVQNIWVFVYCAFGAMLNKHTCFF